MGAPIRSAFATYTDFMYGNRRGAEVIVRAMRAEHAGETVATVRVDPPLFLGLSLLERVDVEAMMGVRGHGVGYTPIDVAFRVESHDPARTSALLRPQRLDGRDLAQQLACLAGRGLFVSDTNVELTRKGVTHDVQELADDLDAAADIALRLGHRRAELGSTPREHVQVECWQSFASARGLTFDPLRMDLHGNLAGGPLRVCLDSERGEIDTLVSVGFDVSLGVALRVGHQVGGRLVVTGQPEALVQDILARASPALVDLARRSRDVELTERELFVRVPGSTPTESQLDRLVNAACGLANLLTGQAPQAGPYR